MGAVAGCTRDAEPLCERQAIGAAFFKHGQSRFIKTHDTSHDASFPPSPPHPDSALFKPAGGVIIGRTTDAYGVLLRSDSGSELLASINGKQIDFANAIVALAPESDFVLAGTAPMVLRATVLEPSTWQLLANPGEALVLMDGRAHLSHLDDDFKAGGDCDLSAGHSNSHLMTLIATSSKVRLRSVSAIRKAVLSKDLFANPAGSIRALSHELGCTDRTLNRLFNAVVGMGPKRFLKAVQMNLIHEQIKENSSGSGVTTIMTTFGVTELGRASAYYKSLFGELPSETLARAMEKPPCGSPSEMTS